MDNLKLTRVIDRNAFYLGVSGLVLMENAGRSIYLKASAYDSIAVFCGTGNNGGDGLVAARHLSGAGKRVKVYSLRGERTEGNAINFDIIKKLDSIELELISDSAQTEKIVEELNEFGCVIDALVGTGISGELREPVKSIVKAINSSRVYKIAVDIPTRGLESDLVLSFHLPKTGDAEVVDIGIPREAGLYAGPGDVCLSIPERPGGVHKGDFGRVLVVGGSRDYTGAPYLAGLASMRSGADLSYIASPSYVLDRGALDPNLIYIRLDSESYLSKGDVEPILERSYDSLVLGNGLGLAEESGYAVKKILRRVEKPLVLDADALKHIGWRDLGKSLAATVVLTPHAGEFEMLFGEKPLHPETVRGWAEKTGTIILLKGETDVISDGSVLRFNRTGNPGMTVGGTGDVLAGIAGALLCNTGVDGFTAAVSAAFISGLAGDLCLKEKGFNFLATDVIEKIPEAFLFCSSY